MTDPSPSIPVEELGRDFYIDGIAGSTAEYLSEVKVINLTPYPVKEIKTSVITLEQDAFPVPEINNDPNTTPISVSSSENELGYVQWEPMGDLYPPTFISPYGSYKYLRVKWETSLPAGSDTADYTKNGSIDGPYDYYAEKTYVFRALEPQSVVTFALTPGVLSALGAYGNTPLEMQFSAHGYVNTFTMLNGLYGQDKQTDYPDGSSLIPAERDVIYNRFFGQIGSTDDSPTSQGEQCLAKEYHVKGRIVPELDSSTAIFDPVTSGTSGMDAPPLWYQFHYELQHNKNIIPFTFMWGVGMLTYDAGTYNPSGKDMDKQDLNGMAGEGPKTSSNHGPRVRSNAWMEYLRSLDDVTPFLPNIFHSFDDITLSFLGPDVVCHASSVNVCAVYSDTVGSLNRTIINWFDKSNQSWYDTQIYGVNYLPQHATWVLRGAIHINSNYVPVTLSTDDTNSQLSNSLERTWAIDQNFEERKLFTVYKNTVPSPPQELLDYYGYTNKYQTAAFLAHYMWDTSGIEIEGYRLPYDLITKPASPFYNDPPLFEASVGFLKGLHEPWAMNPIGLNARPGVAGGQPGFAFVGPVSINAAAGLPDMRAFEVCVDLEWNRLFVEAERDGSLLDVLGDAWTNKRWMTNPGNLTNYNLNAYAAEYLGNPSYNGWIGKSINSFEFSGLLEYMKEGPALCFFGLNPAYNGSSTRFSIKRGYSNALYGGRDNWTETYGHQQIRPDGYIGSQDRYFARLRSLGYPIPKHQAAQGYPNNGLFHANNRESFTNSHAAYALQLSYALASGDKIALQLIDYYMKVLMSSHDDGEHGKQLFQKNSVAPGQTFQTVGRMEGRPMQALIGGIGITRNQTLRERAIYMLSRRFWNYTRITNFEDFPTGVPGKPWRTLWYPPWAGSNYLLNLDSNGHPIQNTASYLIRNSNDFSNYWAIIRAAGDMALRKYLPSQLPVSSVAPNFVSSNAASWNGTSVQQTERDYWTDPYFALDTGRFNDLAVSSNPSTLEATQIPYRYTVYRLATTNDPLRAIFVDPPNAGKTVGAGVISPNFLQIPDYALADIPTSRWTTQGYQNALLYGFIWPMLEIFNTYSQIFAARAGSVNLSSIDFPCRHSNPTTLSEELADTYQEQREYFLRAAKSVIKNCLVKFSSQSTVAAGHFGIKYFSSAYSNARKLENFIEAERTVTLDSNGIALSIPRVGEYPTGSNINTVTDQRFFEQYIAGAQYQAEANLVTSGNAGGNPYSTSMWAFNGILWAWDFLYKYGNLSDASIVAALEEAKSYIEDWIGLEPFNATNAAANTRLENHYLKYWGQYGWPSPGSSPSNLQGLLGSDEALPWFAGVAEDLWINRELDQVSIESSFLSELEVDGTVEYERTTVSISEGDFLFELSANGQIEFTRPQTAYLFDQGFSGLTEDIEASSIDVDPSDPDVHYVLAYFFNSDDRLQPMLSSLELGKALTSEFLGELLSDGYIASAAILQINHTGSIIINVDSFNRDFTLANFSSIQEIDLETSELTVFISLPILDVTLETEPSVSSMNLMVPLTADLLGELNPDLSSLGLGLGISIQDDWIGEMIPITTFSDLNPVVSFIGESFPNASILIFDGLQAGESNFNSLVSSVEFDKTAAEFSSLTSEADSFYTGSRRNMPYRFEQELFKELMIRSRGQAKVSEIYRETLEYLINTFASLVYQNDQNEIVKIPCWHGASERVVAKLKSESNIVLPVVSVYRSTDELDPSRRRSASLIVFSKYWDKIKQRAVRVASLAPVPVNIIYRVNVWAKYYEDLDQITEQIHRMFNPDLEVYTKFNSSTKAFLIEEDANVDINIVEGEDRIIKKIFTISVESYIPSPKFVITNSGQIESFNAEIYLPIK